MFCLICKEIFKGAVRTRWWLLLTSPRKSEKGEPFPLCQFLYIAMIGNVTERDVSEVKPISSIVGGSRATQAMPVARNLGFPSAKNTLSLAAPRKKKEAAAAAGVLPKSSQTGRTGMEALAFPPPASAAGSDDSADDNTRVVYSMTRDERAAAMQEVEGILSPEALEFLRNRSKLKAVPAAAPQAAQKQKQPRTLSSSVHVPMSAVSFGSAPATAPGPIATTLDDLWVAQQQAPASVQESLAWTMAAERPPPDAPGAAAAAAASAAAAKATGALKDRYELSGLKLVDPAQMTQRMAACLGALGLDGGATAALAESLYGLASAHLCADVSTILADWEAGDQPQHPLFQHEFETHRPGYTLDESVQLGRSVETHQRAIAYTLLCEILSRRAAILSLEPYVGANGHAAALESGFAQVVEQAAGLCDASGAAVDKDRWGTNLADIRRCLVFALLHATAVDLPPTLPALLVVAVQSLSGKSHWQDKLLIVHLLTAFVASSAEEAAAAELWAMGGPWGAYGAPPLMQSQSRRSEQCYEASALGCVVDRVREQQEQQAAVAENANAQQSQMIQLALQCRYGNIDAMVAAGTLSPLLDVLVTAVDSVCASTSQLDPQGIFAVLRGIAEAGFFVLATIARGGDASSTGLLVALVRKHWQVFSRLLVPTGSAVFMAVQAGLLRLLAELSRRDQTFSAFLNEQQVVTTVLSLLLTSFSTDAQVQDSSQNSAIWGLRLWRALLAYGHGLPCVTELSVAARISLNSQQHQQHSVLHHSCAYAVGPGLVFRGARALVELLLLWESAAVAAAEQAQIVMLATLQPQSQSHVSILEEKDVVFPVKLIDCVETARTVATAAADVMKNVIKPLTQKMLVEQANDHKHQDEAVLAAALHFVASSVGVFPLPVPADASDGSDGRDLVRVQEVAQLRALGLHSVVRACEAFMPGGTAQDSRVEVLRQQIMLLPASCMWLMASNNGAANAFAHAALAAAFQADSVEALDVCLARSRLEQCLTSWKNGVVLDVEMSSLQAHHAFRVQLGAIEQFACTVAPSLPSVAMGLIARHRRRLQEMLLLSSIGTLCLQYLQFSEPARSEFVRSGSPAAVRQVLIQVTGLLGPGMFAPIQVLLSVAIEGSAQEIANAVDTQELVAAVLAGLLGKSDEALAESVALSRHALQGYAGPATSLETATMCSLSSWVLDPHRKQLPLSRQWPMHALYTLSGKSFAEWLDCLSGMAERGDASAGAAAEFVVLRTAELFRILRLASPEFIHKWLSPPAPNTPLHLQEVPEPFPQAITAYFSLIRRLSFIVARASHDADVPLQGVRELCLAASQEMEFSAAGVLAATAEKKSSRVLTAARAASAAAANTSDNGVLELTGKLLESAAGQHVAPSVHAIALSVLLCPLLVPWRVSERAWRELGRYGLLHLVELSREQWSPLLALTFCYAPPGTASGDKGAAGNVCNPLVARSALGGMIAVRGGASNRNLPVYAVAVSTIAGAISGGGALISGRAFRMLAEVMDPSASPSCPDWLARDVLSYLLITAPRLAAAAPILPPAASLDAATAAGLGDKFWEHVDAALHYADQRPQELWDAGSTARWEVQVSASETLSFRDYVRRTRSCLYE